MKKFHRIRKFFPSALGLVAIALGCGIYLGGCIGESDPGLGGTSSEGGNPDLTLQIRGTGDGKKFQGFIQFFVDGANPIFFTPPADDGFSSPKIIMGGEEISTLVLREGNTIKIPGKLLSSLMNAHSIQPLFKSSLSAHNQGLLPAFNVILMGFDSTAGWLKGIQRDSIQKRYQYSDNSGGDTLIIDIAKSKSYLGAIDTLGLPSRPIGLFVPGTPYYAAIHGDSFQFDDMPEGKLPLRLISADGWVRAMIDSLGTPWSHPLKPGERLDSLTMPVPNLVLAPPLANPSGQFAFTDSVSVTLTAENGATIYYSLDGTNPDVGSKRYTVPITFRASATLKAVAFMKDYTRSPVAVNNYVLVPAAPVASPSSRVFRDSLSVALTVKANSGSIFFTLDGTEPMATSKKYTGPILLKETTTLKAITVSPGLGSSRTVEEKYVLIDSLIKNP
jgi:hypothetical protein